MMTKQDQATLAKFNTLAARVAKLEARTRIGYRELMQTTRLYERIAALRDAASPTVRRAMRKGWR